LKFKDGHITIENLDLEPNKNTLPYISVFAPNSCLVNENINFMVVGENLDMVNFPYIVFGNQPILNPELKKNSIIFGQVPPSHIPQIVNLYFFHSNQYQHFGYFTYYDPGFPLVTQSISINKDKNSEILTSIYNNDSSFNVTIDGQLGLGDNVDKNNPQMIPNLQKVDDLKKLTNKKK